MPDAEFLDEVGVFLDEADAIRDVQTLESFSRFRRCVQFFVAIISTFIVVSRDISRC